jgi:hypothetical protein
MVGKEKANKESMEQLIKGYGMKDDVKIDSEHNPPHDRISCECYSCVKWRIENEFDSGHDRELFSQYFYNGEAV